MLIFLNWRGLGSCRGLAGAKWGCPLRWKLQGRVRDGWQGGERGVGEEVSCREDTRLSVGIQSVAKK